MWFICFAVLKNMNDLPVFKNQEMSCKAYFFFLSFCWKKSRSGSTGTPVATISWCRTVLAPCLGCALSWIRWLFSLVCPPLRNQSLSEKRWRSKYVALESDRSGLESWFSHLCGCLILDKWLPLPLLQLSHLLNGGTMVFFKVILFYFFLFLQGGN